MRHAAMTMHAAMQIVPMQLAVYQNAEECSTEYTMK